MLYATKATTHLDHIRANVEGIRARVSADRPDRKVLVAVKANAYGHGMVEVSRMLESSRSADWLGVATVPEGVELRQAGISLPVLKFSPAMTPEEAAAAIAHDVTLTVTNVPCANAVAAVARDIGRGDVAVHVKIDTGMRRIGVEPDAAPALCRHVNGTGVLRVQGVYSHLPISDSPNGRAFTVAQIERFAEAVHRCQSEIGPIELVHLANSGGVLQYPESWFDMVRPGVMVYGNLPDPACEATVALRPGLSWTTIVTYIKRVRAGESVGYGRAWTAPSDTWIATISVGYGDGFNRLQSNNARVLIGGRAYPLVGRVCMDQCMVDLGPDRGDVSVGDEVVLIGRRGGEEITAQELADRVGSITYEVTCQISARVTREYIDS